VAVVGKGFKVLLPRPPYELRRHPEAAMLAWFAAYEHLRARTLTFGHDDPGCKIPKPERLK
jgi:hypothetical protein